MQAGNPSEPSGSQVAIPSTPQTTAWVVGEDGSLWVAHAEASSRVATAVCRLVAGIYAHEGFNSLLLLRRRIFSTVAANDLDRAVVKLAAKRCTFEADFAPVSMSPLIDLSAAVIGDPTADRTEQVGGWGSKWTEFQALRLCRELAASVPLEPERFTSPRPVSALVLDREGLLLGAAVNNNVVDRLRHAELNLVFNRFRDHPIPAGSTVYTSLSPCRMCAALLARVAADGSGIRVVALAADPGRFGRQSSVVVTLAALRDESALT